MEQLNQISMYLMIGLVCLILFVAIVMLRRRRQKPQQQQFEEEGDSSNEQEQPRLSRQWYPSPEDATEGLADAYNPRESPIHGVKAPPAPLKDQANNNGFDFKTALQMVLIEKLRNNEYEPTFELVEDKRKAKGAIDLGGGLKAKVTITARHEQPIVIPPEPEQDAIPDNDKGEPKSGS